MNGTIQWSVKAPEREVIADDDLVFLKKKRPDTLKENISNTS